MAITAAENIGAALVAYRKSCQLSQRDMAQILSRAGFKVDVSRVSRIESGKSDLRVTQLLQLCSVLSLTPDSLLGVTPGATQGANAFAAILRNTIEELAALERKVSR